MIKTLIVDDVPTNRELAKDVLQWKYRDQYEVTMAGDLATAKSLIESKKFDLIIMDMELTPYGTEGVQLIQFARNGATNQKTAIIGWPKYSNPKDEMMSAGADAFAPREEGSSINNFLAAIKNAFTAAKERDPQNYVFFDPESPVKSAQR